MLQKGNYCVGFEVSCRKLLLSEFIFCLCLDKHSSRLLGGKKCFSKACVILDVLLYQLIHRDIEHIILDAKIGTGRVDRESLLMIHQNHSRLKHFLQDVDLGLL